MQLCQVLESREGELEGESHQLQLSHGSCTEERGSPPQCPGLSICSGAGGVITGPVEI